MKIKTKIHLESFGISFAINNRPNKTAIGMTYTNERRARATRHSFCIQSFSNSNKYKLSKEARTLAIYGTLDKIKSKVIGYKIRKFLKERKLKEQLK